jgi:hypothetical protein
MYLFAASSEAFDDWASEFQRERWLWSGGAGDWITRAVWTDHCDV